MYKTLFLSPMIPSYNIQETVSFFSNLLGFVAVMKTESYAICRKDHFTIHILKAGHDIGEMEFYMEVDDVDGIWSTIKDKLDGIKVKSPFNQEYGMREIHIVIPQTKTLMFIGEESKEDAV